MLRVLLMQLPVPNNPVTNVPLALGYLKAYAHTQGLLERARIDILPRAIVDSAGDALLVEEIARRAPDILGISLYTWNSERSLDIARRAKERLPKLLVVVGGPEVQRDNEWVLQHPGADLCVIGEGEQTFAEILRASIEAVTKGRSPVAARGLLFSAIPGLAFRDDVGNCILTPERQALNDLSGVPSPYLLGYLDVEPGGMLMVEVSRWCPYSCSFCLYGRNMGPKLGSRYFSLERVLAEIAWGKRRGVTSVHFIEANLNLVPLFKDLMTALADINADKQLALYAELRGEHLKEETVEALAQAGLKVAEVGLQTANVTALKAALRRTDLAKWAAGTRRLYAHGVEVLLDVIVGLPQDDADGIMQTLSFIEQEQLGAYDAFTLQVLPGTAVRAQADTHGLIFQNLPPYYVLQTSQFSYAEMRRLRRELKLGVGLEPDAVEGMPPPRLDALTTKNNQALSHRVLLDQKASQTREYTRLASHVDLVGCWSSATAQWASWLAGAIATNPSTIFDLYLIEDAPPGPRELQAWREALPYQPGYLDRVAVYRRPSPVPQHEQVSPRVWLVVPWTANIEPHDYTGIAEVIWTYELAEGEEPPLGAWRAAGGAGIWVCGATPKQLASWRQQANISLWA
jgi:radical SAM superfamily enzyme YgiQ (UPF0313 family)